MRSDNGCSYWMIGPALRGPVALGAGAFTGVLSYAPGGSGKRSPGALLAAAWSGIRASSR